MRNLRIHKIVWLIVFVLSFTISGLSIIFQDLYQGVVSQEIIPGTIAQDGMTLILSVLGFGLVLSVKANKRVTQVLILSILFYMFYAYSIYVIEQIYTSFYIGYILIVAATFWALIFALLSINLSDYKKVILSKNLRYITVVFSLFTVCLFTILWIAQLIPLMIHHQKPDFTYSIYILDLVYIMPAFLIVSILLFKKKTIGLVLSPILFFKAFTLLFSVGVGYYVRSFYGFPITFGGGMFYLVISIMFFIVSFYQLRSIYRAE